MSTRHYFLHLKRSAKLVQSMWRRRQWSRYRDVVLGASAGAQHGANRKASVRLIRPLDSSEPVALGRSARWYTGTSLCCALVPSHPVRLRFMRLLEWRWFERLTLLTILANCALLAAMGPNGSGLKHLIDAAAAERIEIAFLSFFTAELLCRATAMGFVFGAESYLSSGWNRLDLLVVVLGWLPFVSPLDVNGSAARAMRTLRPLRTLASHSGMRQQVNTLISSLPKLADVMLLLGFIMLMYGILGVELFRDRLLDRCYLPSGVQPMDAELGVCAATAACGVSCDANAPASEIEPKVAGGSS